MAPDSFIKFPFVEVAVLRNVRQIIELEYQVRPVPANLSVITFKEWFCWAKYPHTQTGLTNNTCKSIEGSFCLNCIQIKTNSGNAHYNDQYIKEILVLKMSQKSQILKCERTTKIHSINTVIIDVGYGYDGGTVVHEKLQTYENEIE